MVKKQLIRLLFLNILILNLQAVNQSRDTKRALEDYYFVLLMGESCLGSNNYRCVFFALTDLKVCRFPGGPLWSNSIATSELYTISQDVYEDLLKSTPKMAILCLDYNVFKRKCQNECKQSICGFALPWDLGMAYVFDDLQNIDQVSGLIIEKNKLEEFKLEFCLKKFDFNRNDLIVIDADQGSGLDDIDLLLAGETDLGEQIEFKPMSYPMQKITNFFGKIVISCIMGYLDLKQKIIKIMRNIYARPKT